MNKNTCRRKYKKTAQKPFLHKVLNQNALSFRYIKNNEKIYKFNYRHYNKYTI